MIPNCCAGIRNMFFRGGLFYNPNNGLVYMLGKVDSRYPEDGPWISYLRYCPSCGKPICKTLFEQGAFSNKPRGAI